MEVARSNDGLNPLEIPEIMDHIFQFCGLQDLKECRQVSKFWKENSRKAFVSKSQVHLTFGENRTEMSEFFKFVKFNEDHRKRPFENYVLSGRLYGSWQFWGLCGTFVKKLVLEDCTFVGVEAFRTIIFKSLPNIQHLEFTWGVTIHPRGEEWKEETVQWGEPKFGVNGNLKTLILFDDLEYSEMELLTHFPALEVLSLLSNCNRRSWFESIEKIRQRDPNALKLKSVRIHDDIHGFGASDAAFRVLADSQLPLEEIQLSVYDMDDENRVRGIIWSHTDTLKKLNLSLYGALNLENIFRSPGNTKLKIEELILLQPTFSSLEFLKCMPKLKFINCDLTWYEASNSLEIEDLCLPECTKVECWGFEGNDKRLESFLRCFPNVQELTVWDVNNKMFSWICENCPNLVHLAIYSGTVDDCGLTGLDAEDVAASNENHEWKPITVRRANISSLPSLRKIHLGTGFNLLDISLGNSVVTYGFRQLPRLQNLRTKHYDVQPMAREALHRLFPNCEIHLNKIGKVTMCVCSVFGAGLD